MCIILPPLSAPSPVSFPAVLPELLPTQQDPLSLSAQALYPYMLFNSSCELQSPMFLSPQSLLFVELCFVTYPTFIS